MNTSRVTALINVPLVRGFWWSVAGVLALACVPAMLVAEVSVGDTEAKVVAELGAPTGTLSMGVRKRVTYPEGAITYVNGVVSAIDPKLQAALAGKSVRPNAAAAGTSATKAGAERTGTRSATADTVPAKRSTTPTGLVRGFSLATRMFDAPTDYFKGEVRRAWAASMAADPDEKDDPTTVITYTPGSHSALLYVPPSYDRSKAYGLFVDVRPHDVGDIIAGYEKICADRHLIWVSPDHAGNEQHTALRCALALDALASVRQKYRIDDTRVYVGGFSGGGAVAAQLAILFPEYFRGAVIVARGVRLQRSAAGNGRYWPSAFSYLNSRQLESASHQGLRAAFITGPGDMNHEHVLASVAQWKSSGFAVQGFDVPGMGHEDAPPAIFAEALRWIEERP